MATGERIVYETLPPVQGGSPPPHSGHVPTPYFTSDTFYRYTAPPPWREEQPSIIAVVMAYVHAPYIGSWRAVTPELGHGVTPAYMAPNPYVAGDGSQDISIGGRAAVLDVQGRSRRV